MGLIDLKTDLKSLRYGKDTIGGGYSGQPYIQTPIPDGFNNLGANEDFVLRGGVNAIGDAATDVKRLTKMFFDLKSPNGVLFIAKQNLLSQTAVRTQTSDTVNEGVYTPLNTLAQAGVVELGGHLNKQGINPFIETGAYANSEILYSVKVKPTQLTEENRLARLYQLVSINAADKLDGFILNNGPQNVLTYEGGPNSILGAGKTNIRYSSFRTGKQNPQYVKDPNFFTGKNNQKSINIDNQQVGGLKIDWLKPWTKQDTYYISYKKEKIISINLPSSNINSPQSSSLSFIPYGPKTWNPQHDLPALGYSNNGFVENKEYIYNIVTNSPISEIGGLYDSFFLFNQNWEQYWNVDGKRLQQTSVYKSGSLEPYDPVVNGQKIQKSVNGDNISNGGLKVFVGNPQRPKPWIKGEDYKLPDNNLNSPQSSSLSNIPDGSKTWEKQWEDADNIPKAYNVTNAVKTLSTLFKKSFPVSNLENLFLDDVFDPTTGQRINGTENVYISKTTPTGTDYLNSPAPPGAGTVKASSPYADNTITYNQEDLLDANPTTNSPAIKEDFRKILRQKNPNTAEYYADLGQLTNAPGYIDNNVGLKKQIGNPGQRKNKSYASYTKGVSYSGEIKALDQINASPIGTGVNAPEGGSNNDLVTFNITPFGGSETLNFRAFLGSFSDNYSADIQSQKYVGRGENFYTYGGQTRKISLSWTVAALSKQELIPMYKKLSYLASNTAPIYKDGFMQGPLVTLTVGGYVNELPGYIDGLTLEMGEDSTWEIGIDDNGGRDKTVAQLAHIIKVSGFNFTPIPTYLPQKGAHFIDLWNGSGTLWSGEATSLT